MYWDLSTAIRRWPSFLPTPRPHAHRQIGKARVTARIHALNRQLKEGLAAMGQVRLRTPLDEDLSAGLVCFEVAGLSAQGVVDRLRARGVIATTTPYATSYARLAPGLLNSPEEVDAVLAAMSALVADPARRLWPALRAGSRGLGEVADRSW